MIVVNAGIEKRDVQKFDTIVMWDEVMSQAGENSAVETTGEKDCNAWSFLIRLNRSTPAYVADSKLERLAKKSLQLKDGRRSASQWRPRSITTVLIESRERRWLRQISRRSIFILVCVPRRVEAVGVCPR